MTKSKRLPLPKRLNVGLTEKAYANLRALNETWHFGNNYLLVVLLENLDELVDEAKLRHVFEAFIAEYGQPKGPGAQQEGPGGQQEGPSGQQR